MQRQIVLDTETTGLNTHEDRIVEFGAVELVDYRPTGNTYHAFFNPEREMPEDAAAVHGLTTAFLSGQPVFAQGVEEILTFIGQSPLVMHNADFDMGFLNAELRRCGLEELPMARAIDTLAIARRKFPGGRASLDALLDRFGIDRSERDAHHGAMLDAHLLCRVYQELVERQAALHFEEGKTGHGRIAAPARNYRPFVLRATAHERDIDQSLRESLKKPAAP